MYTSYVDVRIINTYIIFTRTVLPNIDARDSFKRGYSFSGLGLGVTQDTALRVRFGSDSGYSDSIYSF